MTFYESEKTVKNDYFVLTGHTADDLIFQGISNNLSKLKSDGRLEFITQSTMAKYASNELTSVIRKNIQEEADYQVDSVRSSMQTEQRNDEQSYYLQDMIPWDTQTLLDLGCGTGYWSSRISKLYPWIKIIGTDWGKDFIELAKTRYASNNVSFQIENMADLSFPSNFFDCVYADNVIEHSYNVENVLSEIYRVLRPNGLLLAALPSDARNAKKICVSHTWKTAPHEVQMRMDNAGFLNVHIEEIDTYLELGMPPYPPSNDKMIYILARKYSEPATLLQRAINSMNWIYENINSDDSNLETDPIQILKNKRTSRHGFVNVLGHLLKREGYKIKWIRMVAKNHPEGTEFNKEEFHDVIQIILSSKKKVIIDPAVNIYFENNIEELLKHPNLSNINRKIDARYIERNYDQYSTPKWYSKVVKYSIRDDFEAKHKFIIVDRRT